MVEENRDTRAPLVEENARLKDRLRSVCQALVTAVGADGPCDAEHEAAKAKRARKAAKRATQRGEGD